MSWLGRIFGGDDGNHGQVLQLPGDNNRFFPGGAVESFRVVGTRAATDPATGRRVIRSGVGVSFQSRQEAEQLAETQAQAALDAALAGTAADRAGYAYLVNRKAEPVVATLDGDSPPAARITVNGYGALVLNAARALFVDIDTSDEGEHPSESVPSAITDALARHPELRFGCYRTRGGWRLLCTSQVFDPESIETRALLADLGADPKYVLLCRVQRSFRARLTPKPWRAGYRPRAVAAGDPVSRAEVQRYINGTWRYATARQVATGAPDETAPEIVPIVQFHDQWTQAASGKPLA